MQQTDNLTDDVFENVEKNVQQNSMNDNLRVAKLMLLGVMIIRDRKTDKPKGANITFIDSVECDRETGQPVIRGFNPIINCYVATDKVSTEVAKAVLDLAHKPVFSTLFVRISGMGDFVKFHSILSDEEVERYRKIMLGLI